MPALSESGQCRSEFDRCLDRANTGYKRGKAMLEMRAVLGLGGHHEEHVLAGQCRQRRRALCRAHASILTRSMASGIAGVADRLDDLEPFEVWRTQVEPLTLALAGVGVGLAKRLRVRPGLKVLP